MSGYLYVIHIGNVIKVGKTRDLGRRYATYQRDADQYGLTFMPLFATDAHEEVDANEIAVLDRFRPPGQRREYLRDVDPEEVIAFIQALPRTPPAIPEPTAWIPRMQAMERLRVGPGAFDRYVKAGRIRARTNGRNRVFVPVEDLDSFLRMVRA